MKKKSNSKEVSKEELASRRSSAYEYYDFKDKESNKITYSEEEVRTLIIEAIESFNDDVDEEVIISWFNHNKKK